MSCGGYVFVLSTFLIRTVWDRTRSIPSTVKCNRCATCKYAQFISFDYAHGPAHAYTMQKMDHVKHPPWNPGGVDPKIVPPNVHISIWEPADHYGHTWSYLALQWSLLAACIRIYQSPSVLSSFWCVLGTFYIQSHPNHDLMSQLCAEIHFVMLSLAHRFEKSFWFWPQTLWHKSTQRLPWPKLQTSLQSLLRAELFKFADGIQGAGLGVVSERLQSWCTLELRACCMRLRAESHIFIVG